MRLSSYRFTVYDARFLHPVAAVLVSIKVKVKVKLSLCLTKHHVMKTYWGVEA